MTRVAIATTEYDLAMKERRYDAASLLHIIERLIELGEGVNG